MEMRMEWMERCGPKSVPYQGSSGASPSIPPGRQALSQAPSRFHPLQKHAPGHNPQSPSMLRFQKNNCIPSSLPERSGFRATPLDCCGRGSTVQGTARPSAYNAILCIIRSQPQMLQSIHPPARDSGFSAGQCGDRDSTEENNSPWPLFPSSIVNRLVETENPKPKTSTCEQCRCARTFGPLFMFCS
jgi:hypothetical protein